MDELRKFLSALGTVLALFVFVEMLLAYRAVRMRSLARKLGWSYTAGRNHIWELIFKRKAYPSDFRLHGSLMTALRGTMNIIEGECGDTRLVILDSLLHFGARTDRYVTFIGAKTETDPFFLKSDKEIVVHSHGWFALYRSRFSLLTWSLSVDRIEQHLRAVEDWKKFIISSTPHS